MLQSVSDYFGSVGLLNDWEELTEVTADKNQFPTKLLVLITLRSQIHKGSMESLITEFVEHWSFIYDGKSHGPQKLGIV